MKTYLMLLVLLTGFCFVVNAADGPAARLENSPRHQEWVVVKQGDRSIHCFVVYPEVKEKATAVLVIHENKGLTDWVRGVADQLAEAGYIAIAPDLLSGSGPSGGKTSDFTSIDAATQALYQLKPEQVTRDLAAVADYVIQLEACNGKLACIGFCWGGGQTLRFATHRADLKAAGVFYGTSTESKENLARIPCRVYGFYGGNDNRINATLPATKALMQEANRSFDPVIYEGAGHGFMRIGEDSQADAANRKARDAAWARLKDILKSL